MKKMLLLILSASLLVCSCATSGVAGSGVKSNSDMMVKNKNQILDYQGASMGSEIPMWVKFVGDGEYGEKALSKVMPDVAGKKVFVAVARGDNLEFVKQWTDLVDIEVQVGDTMQRVVGKAVSAEMKAAGKSSGVKADASEVEKKISMYKEAVSAVEVNGLEKIASYWLKKLVITPDLENKNGEIKTIEYEYYSVWVMDKGIFESQLDSALKTVEENTSEGKALKAALREKLVGTVATSTPEVEDELYAEF